MRKRLLENHKIYKERISYYKSFGYDVEKERKFILDSAQPVIGTILEVGTGKGHFAIELANKEYNFTSVDISSEEQEFACLNIEYLGLHGKVNFMVDNAEDLSFNDESFDNIFSINTIHHLMNPFKVVDELVRVLTPGGKIVLSDFNNDGFKLIDKIHKSEGRIHSAENTNLSKIHSYLASKAIRTEKYESKFQEVLISYGKAI